ncbi:hypothetical protein ILYODFUR_028744 [Ilyodon furcidens]|uniref:Uncharacterized protein n=1 Tax=Ilyodon furcidens TaxID=33524 RepID=A0ABV0TD19_9TELE
MMTELAMRCLVGLQRRQVLGRPADLQRRQMLERLAEPQRRQKLELKLVTSLQQKLDLALVVVQGCLPDHRRRLELERQVILATYTRFSQHPLLPGYNKLCR